MRRNGTDFMAIGAILAGATIGAGGTAALLGGPLDNRMEATRECESLYFSTVSSTPTRVTWSYSVDRHGEVRKRRCPRIRTTTVRVREPVRTVDAELQAELEALAAALAAARTREQVVQALEGRQEAAATIESLREQVVQALEGRQEAAAANQSSGNR